MAEFIIDDLDDDLLDKLRELANRHGRTVEEEVCAILRTAVMEQPGSKVGLGTRISSQFKDIGLTEDIPEFRGGFVEPIKFDE